MNTSLRINNHFRELLQGSRHTVLDRSMGNVSQGDFFLLKDATDIYEDQNCYRLEVAVPGVNRRDLVVQVDGTLLSVSIQKTERTRGGAAGMINTNARRSFALPDDADINSINAKCRDGLLKITIGKIKPGKTLHYIKVDGNESGETMRSKLTSWWAVFKRDISRLVRE
jgi:HSP20 family molecular chaperone IbpA